MEEDIRFERMGLLRPLVFKTSGLSRAHPIFHKNKNGGPHENRPRTFSLDRGVLYIKLQDQMVHEEGLEPPVTEVV
jgi:hypothetical protein